MNFKKTDEFVNLTLNNKFKKTERRDYRELEKSRPDFFKGYGNKSGLMFLVEVNYNHYIDVNLFEKTQSAKLVFRRDDYNIVYKNVQFYVLEKYLTDMLLLVDEYLETIGKLKMFNQSTITKEIIRDCKLNEIVDEG
jgi:hypothetical protein